jgi:inner membrane protein involved in colicin E2 resistance
MVATRRIDWYSFFERMRSDPAPAASVKA